MLFLQGGQASEVFFIVNGSAKLTMTNTGGREVVTDVCGPGDWIGAMAILSKSSHPASAIALTSNTEALALSQREFEELVRFNSGFNAEVLRELAWELRISSFRQFELAADDVAGRVARRLLELVERFGETDETAGTALFKSPITQQELADWVGVSRQAVVKELRRLRSSGVIETRGSLYTIFRTDVLETNAEALGSLV